MFDRETDGRSLNRDFQRQQKEKTLQMFRDFFINKNTKYGVARTRLLVEFSLSLWMNRIKSDYFLPEDRSYVVVYLETICAGIKYLRLFRKNTLKLEIKLKSILRKYFQYLSLHKIFIAGEEDDAEIVQSECLLITLIEILKIIRRYNVQYIFEEFILQFKKDFIVYLGFDDIDDIDIFSIRREYPFLLIDLVEELYQYDILDLDYVNDFLVFFFKQFDREDIEEDIERDQGLSLIGENIVFADWTELLLWLMEYLSGDNLRTYILEKIFKFNNQVIIAVLSQVVENIIIANSDQDDLDVLAISKYLNSSIIKKYINGIDKPKDGFSQDRIVEIRYLPENDNIEKCEEEEIDDDFE